MISQNLFKWKHFESEIIVLCVRWYLKYSLSDRNLQEIMSERGLSIAHTTIMRWVHEHAPIIDKKIRKYLKPTNDSWRVDETYIKVKGEWKYLYRAVDSEGNTIDFYFSEKRDKQAAKRFFEKALGSSHNQQPRIITVDKNQTYEVAIPELIYGGTLGCRTSFRQIKYLNNILEQDHRFIKRKVKQMRGFKNLKTAEKTICGIEAMNMIRKGQVEEIQCALSEIEFLNKIMGAVA
ncbi:IS6 family transposase [Marinisporobacter balticus]|uniref:IS6 family transposase n=1 Tax=Marinisporobacter balticus TaxID=2018667 RepID=UPI0010444A9E|nr:IS6 family transposase [Marinisporobacter balticus]